MASPFDPVTGPVTVGDPGVVVMLVEGSSFCLSGRSGDMVPGSPQGLFVQDARVLSHFELGINGQPVEPLSVSIEEPFEATIVARARPAAGVHDSSVIVIRRRAVSNGLNETIELRNYGGEAQTLRVEVVCDSDFAGLFAVKEGRTQLVGERSVAVRGDEMIFGWDNGPYNRTTTLRCEGAQLAPGLISWEVTIEAGQTWTTAIEVTTKATETGASKAPPHRNARHGAPHERLGTWRADAPRVETDHQGLRSAVSRAVEDLGALRIFDPERPGLPVIAAGAPWFMTLFGRDSLLTSWMALMVDTELSLGVLQTLARLQGSKEDASSEEEPGRILHEVRFGDSFGDLFGGRGSVYYGSIDSTPLFVMLLGELHRWGLADKSIQELLPHADLACEWILRYGDRDGDGYVEYQRSSETGILNQGWKDSFDSVRHADGRYAEGPIALCEVQGYVYAAFRARAHLAYEAGEIDLAHKFEHRADELKANFNEDFWSDELGCYVMALDGDKRQVEVPASNMGHCLWTGIVDPEKASAIAERLLSPEMFSGWGIRTLGSSALAYNPVSYHNGSVWPHDNALCVAGLMRYGFVEEAHRVILGMLDVASRGGGRLPELFCGLDRTDVPDPVSYPTSCSPQAWAAASPLLFLRSMLRIEPAVAHNKLWLSPALPDEIGELAIRNIALGTSRISIEVSKGRTEVSGLPPEMELITDPRAPEGVTRSLEG